MGDAGIVLFESFDNDIHDNVVDDSEFGIRVVLGAGNNLVHDNEFKGISDGEGRVSRTSQAKPSLAFTASRHRAGQIRLAADGLQPRSSVLQPASLFFSMLLFFVF